MSILNVKINEIDLPIWQQLSVSCQQLLATKVLHSFLNGQLYPTGTEQLELAIELAENGADELVISILTRLDKEAFENFIVK